MLHVGLGQAEGIDTRIVVERAINDCIQQLKGIRPQAGIVFAGPHFDHSLMLDIIMNTFPGIGLVGCSTSGNFSSFHGVSEDAVTLTLLASETLTFGVGAGNGLSTDWQAAVDQAIGSATALLHDQPTLCLTFPQGYSAPFEPVLERLDTKLGPDCPVFGGVSGMLSSEPSEFLQFHGREVMKDGLPILLITGPVEYRFAIANSWRPIGKRALVTRSDNRTIHSIGDFSAVEYYRHYLGYHEEAAGEFLMAVYQKSSQEYYIVSPVQYNDDGSITCTGPVPEGSEIQLTEAIREDLIDDTLETSRLLNEADSSWVPALSLNFSCSYRKALLGTSAEKELNALKQASQPGLPIVGFFSYGEISPLSPGGHSIIQGATLITLLIGPGSRESRSEAGSSLVELTSRVIQDVDNPEFLKRRLMRSEANRQRLESLKDFTVQMHHKMMEELEEARHEMKKGLLLAGEVQKSLLPQENPKVSGLDIAGRNVSCEEVGGDYYDFFLQQDKSDNAFSVAVGDITGHGVDAALLMSSARAFLRMHVGRDESIVDIVDSINRHLAADVQESSRFMTLFYLSIHADLKSLEWVRAGHDPAIIYDPISDTYEDLRGPGLALGIDPEYGYQAIKKDGLTNGSIIAIGTDGIWEAFNQEGEMFGRERFRQLLKTHAELPAAELLSTIFTEVEDFRGGRKSEDDLTLVIIKINN